MGDRGSSRWWWSRLIVGLVGGAVVVGIVVQRWATRAEARLPLARCRLPWVAEPALCGTLAVPEDRSRQGGRTIPLDVAVLPAISATPRTDAIAYLAGGPGDNALAAAPWIGWALAGLRRDRDLLLVAQRGTGASHRLACPDGDLDRDLQDLAEGFFDPIRIRACRTALEKRADLRRYTTDAAARDLEAVRRWLGYRRLDLFAASYGTRLAQRYMRLYPARVRAAVLWGATAPGQHLPLHHAPDAEQAWHRVTEACAAEPACAASFPAPAADLDAVLTRLADRPVTVRLSGGSVRLARGPFGELFRGLLYAPDDAVRLPALLHRAAAGRLEPLLEATLSRERGLRRALALGVYLSVTCTEDLPFIGDQRAASLAAGTFLGDYRVRVQRAACDAWPRGTVPEGFDELVEADTPTLLLTGWLDPVTPPHWARRVASRLPRARLVVVPEGHHTFGGLDHQGCLWRMVGTFLADPRPAAVDPSCVSAMRRPPFDR